jgi:hypothetical protein
MQQPTRELIAALEGVHWFHNVGKGGKETGVIFVSSWDEALQYCMASEWEEKRIGEANGMRASISKERLKDWNPLIEQIRPLVECLAESKMWVLPRAIRNRSHEILRTVSWDLVHACMELEYDSLIKTRFYRDVAQWYLKGHFPCGYENLNSHGVHVVL